jgi:hypothetical protein
MIRQKLYAFLALTVFIISIWYVFFDFSPRYSTDFNAKANEFSTDRAYEHVVKIAETKHYVGTRNHSLTRNYIIQELEKLGLDVHTQQGYSLNKYGEFSIPENIIAKIEGKNPDAKSLVLLSHYDSSPHSSYGASDAASGVATILEAVRAYLESDNQPEHDIIICFSDAEEIGLLGAKLFVGEHPWAKNIGLALNFEARGSGGPSNMIVETNHGNASLIKALAKTDIKNPLGTSLAYSVYKLLPNNTDSTVFREDADVSGFFFAFIDDHFDYHTSLDVPKRLDKNSLAHQGDYAFHALNYFSKVSLDDNLKAETDMIYFNLPEFGLFYYPFSWIWTMYFACIILFVLLLYWGFKHKSLSRKEIFIGFLPFLITLLFSFILGFFGWKAILWIYPQYQEILQGFPYNGHNYIFAFVCLCLSFCFFTYIRFRKRLNPHNAMVAPIIVWFIICAIINVYLPGAAYFILALGFALIVFALSMFREIPNLFLVWLMYIPAIGLITPLILFFPVGLGLNMIVASTLFCALLFGLMFGFFGYMPFQRTLSSILFLLGVAFLIVSHVNSDYTKEQPRPNSLVYVLDHVSEKAYWKTYDVELDEWNASYFKDTLSLKNTTLQSKYSTSFTRSSEAQFINFESSDFYINVDTLDQERVKIQLKIFPQEDVKRIELYADKNYNFEDFSVNKQKADSIYTKTNAYHIFKKRYSSRLLTYSVVNQEDLNIEFIGKLPLPEFEVFETRFDLLQNDKLKIPKRLPYMIPKPFVVNDAIIIQGSILFK